MKLNGSTIKSIVKSYNDARKWLTNFDDQPDDVKKAVIDMSFQPWIYEAK
jgi:hypothetical protein